MSNSTTLPLYDWHIADETDVGQFTCSNLPIPIAKLLKQRELVDVNDETALGAFLDSPLKMLSLPFAMPGVETASKLILDTIDKKGQIVIFGDFDCDGITATSILTAILKFLGADVIPFIPERAEGYGLTDAAVSRCMKQAENAAPVPSCRLLITVDCGMGAGDAFRRFLEAGYQVIVSDHHTPSSELPSECTVITTFDPKAPECCRYLCGAGLAYKIACGVITMRYPLPDRTGRPELHMWMGPLAVATVADVVPLVGENRAYVREGLTVLNRRPGIGIKALIRKAFEKTPVEITAYHLGFILGPHINASGRMETAESALRLLLAENDDSAIEQATHLGNLNASRKRVEELLLQEIEKQLADKTVFDEETDGAAVFTGKNWHPGVVGLAAGKLTARINRPVAVISVDDSGIGRGSVRAPEDRYNVFNALNDCSALLTRFGGHASAAGLSIEEVDIPAFRKAFSEACFKQVNATHVRSVLTIGGVLDADDISDEMMGALRRLEPCGNGNETPCWLLSGVNVKPFVIGKDRTHLRLQITREDDDLQISGIWFGAAQFAPLFESISRWDIAGELSENEFRGDVTIQFAVRDARPHSFA